MPEYKIVVVREVWTQSFRVKANSDEEAIAAIDAGGSDLVEILDDTLEFSHRLDKRFWTVEEAK